MDKLQPLIRQRFWILLGLCLILALFGFFKSQSTIVAATTAREEALKQVLSSIPTGNEANTDYVAKLGEINKGYKSKIDGAVEELFAGQQSRMTWPPQVIKEIPKNDKGVVKYRAPLNTITTRTYSTIYKDLIEDLWKKAEPVCEDAITNTATPGVAGVNPAASQAELLRAIRSGAIRPRGNRRTRQFLQGQTILYGQPGFLPVTWAEKVYVDRQAIPQKVLPQIPSPDTIWDCQEDIWFTELLLEAVRKSNRNAENALTSPVRVLSRIELRGGAGAGAAAVDPAAMGMGDMEGSIDGMDGGAMAGASMGMGETGMPGAPGMMAPPPATSFDPAEVFGPELAGPIGGGMEGGGDVMSEGSDPSAGMGLGMMGPPPTLRWVGTTEGVPFRERGFYLSVIINQQRIPDFLVNLCEGEWPTKILRFQMGPNPYRKEIAGTNPMLGGMGGDMYGDAAGSYGAMPLGGGFGGGMPGEAFGEGGGMGMMGMGAMTANRYPGGPPQFAGTLADPFRGSLNHPDLVQLDIAGIITFYVPPEVAAATDAPAIDTPSAPGGEAALLEEAAKEAAAAAAGQTPAAAPADGAAPATPPATPPADGATPPATPATPPAGGESPVSPAPPTGEPAAPPAGETPAATPAPATGT